MSNITSKDWWIAAAWRAIKTGAQSLLTLMGTGAVGIVSFDWPQMLSVTATMMVMSLLTSLAGLPEVDDKPKATTDTKEA